MSVACRVVIVGGGLTGLISLAQACMSGANADLIERSSKLGGDSHKFKIDLDEDNLSFLKEVGVADPASLTPDSAFPLLVEALSKYAQAKPARSVRIVYNTQATSILTNSEQTAVLGVHFKKVFESHGKSHSPEGNIFGDSVVFALKGSSLSGLWEDKMVAKEHLLINAGGEALTATYVSKGDLSGDLSLNQTISLARNAGKLASQKVTKEERRIRQPFAFVDKVGVFHGVALKPEEWVPFKLENRIQLNKFNHLFRFALPNETDQSGLFCGQYISIRAVLEGKDVVRYYSPVSRNSDYGHIDLMIKIEENLANKPMERFMSELKVGDTVDFKGPLGGFEYHRNMYREVGMIAGGTGITPMVQIIRSVANHPEDDTKVRLLYGNYQEEDILCRDELSYYAMTRSNIGVYITLANPPGKWSMGTGFVTAEMIKETLPAPANDIVILLCGPPPMVKANIAALKEVGYTDQMIFSFI